ncbi:hypothetical protein C8R43DRAFT_1195546 [Mycena crocata]|nr:hypothetical protein C8R43DRAFT_1195546 [Mycena crocata]
MQQHRVSHFDNFNRRCRQHIGKPRALSMFFDAHFRQHAQQVLFNISLTSNFTTCFNPDSPPREIWIKIPANGLKNHAAHWHQRLGGTAGAAELYSSFGVPLSKTACPLCKPACRRVDRRRVAPPRMEFPRVQAPIQSRSSSPHAPAARSAALKISIAFLELPQTRLYMSMPYLQHKLPFSRSAERATRPRYYPPLAIIITQILPPFHLPCSSRIQTIFFYYFALNYAFPLAPTGFQEHRDSAKSKNGPKFA